MGCVRQHSWILYILQLKPAHYTLHAHCFWLAGTTKLIHIPWVCAQANLKVHGCDMASENFSSHLIKNACKYYIFISPVAYHFHCIFAIYPWTNVLMHFLINTVIQLYSANYRNIFYMTVSNQLTISFIWWCYSSNAKFPMLFGYQNSNNCCNCYSRYADNYGCSDNSRY